jgi:aspartate/methionine/tyrosine aminotransferase
MRYTPFEMERWQSTHEHRVRYNLSESGVHPLTTGELLTLAALDGDGGAGLGGRGAEEALTALRLGYGQSNGSDELRARIAALYPDATEESVLVTVGGAEANFTACWHLMEPGDRAAVILPNYMQVPGLLDTFGVTVDPIHLREEDGWRPDLGEVRDALARGARFLLVTNPNNPTGAALPEEDIAALAGLADAAGAWLLADEVYCGAELEGAPTPTFQGRNERTLVTNSLSKAYGLPGLRIGWIVAPPALREDLWGRTDYTTITPATLSDALATIALHPSTRARILERTREILRTNLGIMSDWIAEHADLLHCRPPDAGAICYIRYDAPVNSGALAERLRVEKDVLLVPGDQFGMDGYIRIGFGLPEHELVEGLGRVAETLREVRG